MSRVHIRPNKGPIDNELSKMSSVPFMSNSVHTMHHRKSIERKKEAQRVEAASTTGGRKPIDAAWRWTPSVAGSEVMRYSSARALLLQVSTDDLVVRIQGMLSRN